MRCEACSRPDPPARCSRCLGAWFCGPECQRDAWPQHKLLCVPRGSTSSSLRKGIKHEPGKLPGYASGAQSDEVLFASPAPPLQTQQALNAVRNLAESQNALEALGTALYARLAATGAQADFTALKQVADVLWEKYKWEPHARERHEYSLLHAVPDGREAGEASAARADGQAEAAEAAAATKARQGSPGSPGLRHDPALCGRPCPVIDAQGSLSPAVKKQLASYLDPRSPYPCIIRNLPIFQRAVENWDVDYLCEHMGDQLYHTFASSQDARRFAYSFECRNEGGYEPTSIAEACQMTFKDFVRKQQTNEDGKSYYLQTPVLRYEDGIVTSAKFDEQLEADLHTMDRRIVKDLEKLGGFGDLSRNQLFVSYSDFLTAVHYDQQHNLYLQLRGCKRFLLFDVTCAPGLYPYPVHHSLDRKGRVDLEDPDLDGWPRARALAGRGVEALLGPGDLLFLPMSWFHHVHSIGKENVSLNFWFYDSGMLFDPLKVQWPLSDISLMELCRHVEYFVAEQLGPSLVGMFMAWWLGRASCPQDKLLADRWRVVRNYVLRQLLKLPPNSRFVLSVLDPLRWRNLEYQSQATAATQGLRDEHRVTELFQGLSELALGVFHCRMPAWAYRVLGRALDKIPRHKLRFFLECCEEVLATLRDHTQWGERTGAAGADPKKGRALFDRDEARKAPAAILRTLGELCDLADARYVRVAIVDNGLFANWLQVLDACYFASSEARIEPDWAITGQEREFNYGSVGDDVFRALFQPLSNGTPCEPRFDVTHRFNFLLVNVFRGQFLRGAGSVSRRAAYAQAAQMLKPCAEVLELRDRLLEARGTGIPMIGVHKRVDNPGTARMQLEQTLLRTESYIEAVRKLLSKYRRGGLEPKVLLASDDEAAAAAFQKAFGSQLICNETAQRCEGGVNELLLPKEVHGQSTRLTLGDARDCLVDALLLASCDAVVHADSNVTIAACIMNPKSDVYHVRELVGMGQEGDAWPGYNRCGLPF